MFLHNPQPVRESDAGAECVSIWDSGAAFQRSNGGLRLPGGA